MLNFGLRQSFVTAFKTGKCLFGAELMNFHNDSCWQELKKLYLVEMIVSAK
jgi:hypothetical protein